MMNGVEEWQSYTTICRLCMQRDGFMLGIFNRIQGKDRCIYQKIMDCTALEVSSSDGLPNSICHRCLYKIEFCLEFRQQCFVSDTTLRQINGLSKEIQATLQPDSESNVVMVVDPNTLDYVSDCESDVGTQPLPEAPTEQAPSSDVEAADTLDAFEYKNVHMCKYCDRAFTEKAECVRHELDEHDAQTPYRCAVCSGCFGDRNAYSTHLKAAHYNDKPYACPECERSFARRSDLRKHTIVHTGVKPFTCPICAKSFSRNTNLSKHIRIHKGQKPFVCAHCPRTFMSKLDLQQHAVQHATAKPFNCDMCHMSFMRKDKLQKHQKRHLPLAATSEDTVAELAAMRENLLSEYGVITTDFAALTASADTNDNHMEATPTEDMVVNIDPFHTEKSENDSEVTDNVENFEEMASSPTRDDIPQVPHVAHVTGDSFSSDVDDKLALAKTAADRFPCSLCSKNFKSTDSLNLHMGMHTGERPFGCHVCGKAFFRKRELERHTATHTGIKKFQCKMCEKRFSRKDKLLRHSRIHEVNKEECPVCMATFNRRDGLLQHMKTHVKVEKDAAGL